MTVSRRNFLKLMGLAAGTLAVGRVQAHTGGSDTAEGGFGMLTDISLCIGCRSCEQACHDINAMPEPDEPFTDPGVFKKYRRMTEKTYTVVNKFNSVYKEGLPVYTKIQCMHCQDPACVSACLVGALQKTKEGPVLWDSWKCMGCRYCMIACPFEVPAYEYHKGIEPRVMKCTMCYPLVKQGGIPACASVCPVEAIKFGPKKELLGYARERIKQHPDRYINHIYGEHEVGGTDWIYIAPQDFATMGFLSLSPEAPPRLTEAIQHGVFKYFIPPVLLFGVLGLTMFLTKNNGGEQNDSHHTSLGDGGGPHVKGAVKK
ncbi:MAG: 4Fe-4S dicluster domain-containing protein [Deltaproteobacteria bacterium]|nr:4Fe-4S dicluster domain-containing protein [Deltaproteobacteria bacterium]